MTARRLVIFALAALAFTVQALWFLWPGGRTAPPPGTPPSQAAGRLEEAPGRPVQEASAPMPNFFDARQNPITAREAFEQILAAAEAGSVPAMLNTAEFYARGWGVEQNLTERYKWYLKAAEAGDPQGYYRAGLCLELGQGVPADPARARAFFEESERLRRPGAPGAEPLDP